MSEIKNSTIFYKGKVLSIQDPKNIGRVQVYIPRVHGEFDPSRQTATEEQGSYPWAPSLVSTLPDEDGIYQINVDYLVMVGFEGNDLSLPIVFGVYNNTTSILGSQGALMGGVENMYSGGSLASLAAEIIFGNEGGYTTVNWNDNGAISIGKIQWHAGRACDLLNSIRGKNQTNFDNICNSCGSNLVSLLGNRNAWSGYKYWTSSCPIGKSIVQILGTEESKKTQDEEAEKNVSNYIQHGQSLGITDPACLIYYADLENQWGEGGAKSAGQYAATVNDLDKFHNWCMQQKYGAYKTRRNSTYQKIKVLKETGKLTPTQLTSLAGGPGGKVLWPCPTLPNAKITSNYGMRGAIAGTSHKTANFHNGVDIGVPSGTPVVAVASGQVIVSGFNAGGYGNWVVIKHPQLNIVSLYAHGTSRKATVGAQVSAGQEILISGSTGNSSGPHLHFTLANGQDANSSTIGNSKVGAAKSFDPLPWIKG